MEKLDYWSLFLETGAPEFYMMYRGAERTSNPGEKNVSKNTGAGAAGNGVQ